MNFYRDFSQLKYIKILSIKKENIKLDKSTRKIFEENNDKILAINNQIEDIKILKQKNIISNEIRNKLETENIQLNKKLINIQKNFEEQNKKITKIKIKNQNIEFLELNLLYGHKCRKTFFKSTLYTVNSQKYRACVLRKGANKKN